MSPKGPCVKGHVLLWADVKGRGGVRSSGHRGRSLEGGGGPWLLFLFPFLIMESVILLCCCMLPHYRSTATGQLAWTGTSELKLTPYSLSMVHLRCFSQYQEVTTGGLPFQWWWGFLNLISPNLWYFSFRLVSSKSASSFCGILCIYFKNICWGLNLGPYIARQVH